MLDDLPYSLLSQFGEHPGRGGGEFYHRPGGGGFIKYFWPPEGGVPAGTSDENSLSVGVVECTEAIQDSPGHFIKGTAKGVVQNIVSYATGVSRKPIACIPNAYGSWTILIEDCTQTATSHTQSFIDPTSQGMINSVNENVGA